jgi:hypothetical protein
MFDNPTDFQAGNLAALSVDKLRYRDWSIGDFVKWAEGNGEHLSIPDAITKYGLRYSNAIEVKWSHHPAGQSRPGGWAGPGTGFTLGLLVSGAFVVQFRKPDTTDVKDVNLTEKGDYVAWRSAMFDHTWNALKESDFLTIRWWDAANPHQSASAV